MDVTTYLRRENKRFAYKSKQVKDFSVFDFSHIPVEPLMRDEVDGLLRAIVRFGRSGIPTHQAIIGSRGSGKTLTLKCLGRIVPAETAPGGSWE